MGYHEHQQRARVEITEPLRCGVVTISDTRTFDTDTSGATVCATLTQSGHDVVRYEVVRDEPTEIAALIRTLACAGCKVIITNGGTGVAQRDNTIEALEGLIEKRLPGFGELFRMLSYHDIGPAAMLSRACAGTSQGVLIFCLPGSTAAVRLALEKLIMPELSHLVWETVRQ